MRTLLLAGGLTAAAVAVVVGTASTNSNTIPPKAVGYGTSTISGATATSVDYVRTADLANIDHVDLVFEGDLTGQDVQANFNGSANTTCDIGATSPIDGQHPQGTTAVSCPFAGNGITVLVHDATGFNVAVTGDPIPSV
jgi:hypothetical protein